MKKFFYLLQRNLKFLKKEKDFKEVEYKRYYHSGKLASKGYYKNKKPEGYWEFYSQNGKLESKGFFENGLLNGKWIIFNSDNFLNGGYQQLTYKKGMFKGLCILYDNFNILEKKYFI